MTVTGWVAFVERPRWEAAWNLFGALLVGKNAAVAPRLGDAAMAAALLAADAATCGARQREALVTPGLCPPDGVGSCRGEGGCYFAALRPPAADSAPARAFVYHLGPVAPAASFPLGAERAFAARLYAELQRACELAGELEWPAIVSARPTCYVCGKTYARGTERCPACGRELAPQDAWDRGAGAPLRKLLFVAFEETWAELATDHQRVVALVLRAHLRGMPFGTFPGAPTHFYLPAEAAAIVQHLDATPAPEDARPFGYQFRAWLWRASSRGEVVLVRG